MDRVFLDANVLWQASYLPGAYLRRLWDPEERELFTSTYAVAEVRVNFRARDQAARLADLLRGVQVLPGSSRGPRPPGLVLPPKDWPIFWGAVVARAGFLITQDKEHFGNYLGKTFEGVKILTPSLYLAQG